MSGLVLAAGDFLLRPPRVAEAPEVLELALDPDVRTWNPRCRITDLEGAVEDCVSGADWSSGTHATFSVIHGETGRYAGNIALHGIDTVRRQASVGYRIAPWTRGRGVATAAVNALVAWAFPRYGLGRISLTHAVENTASCRVAEKCGFTLRAVLPENKRFGDGELHDEHLHVIGQPLAAALS
jgi:RimJ/RimL family protein N-acetyltransferase